MPRMWTGIELDMIRRIHWDRSYAMLMSFTYSFGLISIHMLSNIKKILGKLP